MKKTAFLLVVTLFLFSCQALAKGDRWMYLDSNELSEAWFDTYTIHAKVDRPDKLLINVIIKTNFTKEFADQVIEEIVLDKQRYYGLSYRIDRMQFDVKEKKVLFLSSEYYDSLGFFLAYLPTSMEWQQIPENSRQEKNFNFIINYYQNEKAELIGKRS